MNMGQWVKDELVKMQRISYREGQEDALRAAAAGFRAAGMESVAFTIDRMILSLRAANDILDSLNES